MDDIDILNDKIDHLSDQLKKTQGNLNELLEYLVRTDPNFATNEASFEDWRRRLQILREADRIQKEVNDAKRVLANHGYIVAAGPEELDAARVKHWVESKDMSAPKARNIDDDDIPF